MSGSNPKAPGAGSTAGPRGLVTGKEEKKKAGAGVLNRLKARRQAPPNAADDGLGAPVTEQELLALDTIRPEHVLRLGRVTESECGRPRPPLAPTRGPCRGARSPSLSGPACGPSAPASGWKGTPVLNCLPRVRPHDPTGCPCPLALGRAFPPQRTWLGGVPFVSPDPPTWCVGRWPSPWKPPAIRDVPA